LPVIWTESGKKTGSRNANGNVPNANWNDDKFEVNWNYSNNQNDSLRARAEIPALKGVLETPFMLNTLSIRWSF
jgi:hypothetical protein